MDKKLPNSMQLGHNIINLFARPEEAEGNRRAIHSGEFDALIIPAKQGEQIFTLNGADHPFRILFENMGEAVFTITTEGSIIYANQRFAQLIKKPLEKLPGSSILDWIKPADRGMLQTLLNNGNGQRRLAALNLVAGDGVLIPAKFSLTNLQLDGVSENICVVVTDLNEHELMEELVNGEKIAHQTQDALESKVIERTAELARANKELQQEIAERIYAQQSLAESEARYRSLVENANEAIVVLQDDMIKYANPAAKEIFACPAEKLFIVPFMEFVHPDDRQLISERAKNRLQVNELENPFVYRLETPDNNIKIVSENSDRIKWEGRSAILALLTDITEFKKVEEEVFREDKLNAVGILAGGIAHDFNNYLAVLLSNINLAKLYGNSNDLSKILDRLDSMEKATLRASDLSSQLFTFASGGEPVKEKISLTELIIKDLKFALSGTPVLPRFCLAEDLFLVEADAGQLNQVLNNIAINAVQAMPEGGILKVRAENVTRDAADGNSFQLTDRPYVKITISDSGMGIPEKYLKKIFDPFFTTKDKGRGLGLATSYSIIKKHGGHVGVESHMGVGTTFTILLPAIACAYKTEPAIEDLLQGTGKILIMDDEEALLSVLGESLSALGYEVKLSRDGGQAIELYTHALEQNQPFDLVILDLTIPGGMGGKQTIRELLKKDPRVKAIVTSGYSNDSVMANSENYGFRSALLKPFTIESLSRVIFEAISE